MVKKKVLASGKKTLKNAQASPKKKVTTGKKITVLENLEPDMSLVKKVSMKTLDVTKSRKKLKSKPSISVPDLFVGSPNKPNLSLVPASPTKNKKLKK